MVKNLKNACVQAYFLYKQLESRALLQLSFDDKAKTFVKMYGKNIFLMVLATHDHKVMREFCNKALWLEHGQIKLFGEIDEVFQAFSSLHP